MSRPSLKSLAGLILSLVFLALAIRNVEWSSVWDSWRAARLDLLLLGTLLLVGSWVIAAVRWRVLLPGVKGLRIRDAFSFISIGYLANTVLPLRLGDLVRASLVGRKKNAGISRALGSIAIERLMDVLMLVAMTLALMRVLDIPPAIQHGLTAFSAVALAGLIGLMVVSINRRHLPRLAEWLGKIMPRKLTERLFTVLGNFASGADALHRPSGFLSVIFLSMLLWLTVGAATLLWVFAFHLSVPWYAGFFVLVVVNLGSAIPSSPGYIGVYHYLAVLALSIWVPDRNIALAYAIGTHALNMLANAGLGSYFLAREGISLRALKTEIGSAGQTT